MYNIYIDIKNIYVCEYKKRERTWHNVNNRNLGEGSFGCSSNYSYNFPIGLNYLSVYELCNNLWEEIFLS